MAKTAQKFAEQRVTITGSLFPLQGTLTLPPTTEKCPAVLIIPGTGTSDRDGKNKIFDLKIYRELSEFLGELGYVTLRYDKRGVGESGGDYYTTGFWDLVDDGIACVEFLKKLPAVDAAKIIILGHSEGCWIAPAVNSKLPIQGLILLSGACESASEALPRQAEMAFRELRQLGGFKGFLVRRLNLAAKQQRKNNQYIQKILASDAPSMKILWRRVNAKWLREQYEFNVVHELVQVNCPTLAITGSKDIQVLPSHAQKFAELVKGSSEYHIIPDMTHILRKTSEEPSILSVLKLYKKLALEPIDAELLGLIEHWLANHFGSDIHPVTVGVGSEAQQTLNS